MFATTYIKERNWYNFAIYPYGYKLVTNDSNLDTAQLKVRAEQDERVAALEKAYPNEILFASDVENNTAWNSYESLQSGHLFTPPPFVESAPSSAPASEPAAPAAEPTASVSPVVSPSNPPSTSPELTVMPTPSTTPEPTIEATTIPEATGTPVPSDLAPTPSM